MFATLLGALPRPLLPDGAPLEALVEAAVRAQVAAGLDPVTDGGLHGEDDPVRAWRATTRLTDRSVKQPVTGPYTAEFQRIPDEPAGQAATTSRVAPTMARAATLNGVLRDLAAAGCPLIEIHEPAATLVAADPAERALFRDAHLALTAGVTGVHLSLAITGGSAHAAGIETILAAPYASLAVDLVAGPENWHLVVATPGDRGIVCGALPAAADPYDGPETLLWAAGYAASTKGRGPARVGVATASSLAHLPWVLAVEKMTRLGEAVRIAGLPADERRGALDPRAIDSRSAALGRVDPRPSRGPRQRDEPT